MDPTTSPESSTPGPDLLISVQTLRRAVEHNARRADPCIDEANWSDCPNHEIWFEWPELVADRPVRVRATDRDAGTVDPLEFLRPAQNVPVMKSMLSGIVPAEDMWFDPPVPISMIWARMRAAYESSWDNYWATVSFARMIVSPDTDRPLWVAYVSDSPRSDISSDRDRVMCDRLARAELLHPNSPAVDPSDRV